MEDRVSAEDKIFDWMAVPNRMIEYKNVKDKKSFVLGLRGKLAAPGIINRTDEALLEKLGPLCV